MLYRPPDGKLWDTFLMREGGRFHLFHLRGGRKLGHATSPDLVRWQVRPLIDMTGPRGAWNQEGAPWTGCVVPHGGRFRMLAGGPGPDGMPGYGLLESDDLDNWEQLSADAVLVPRPPHYRREPSSVHFMHAAWRDPCVIEHEGCYHAFLCARSPKWSADDTGAVVAHLRSRDLERWEHLPPLAHAGDRVVYAEVPDVFRIGDWWYLLFLDHGWGGTRINSAARSDMAGTFYMRARTLEGPYEWPDEPLLIGCGGDRMGPWAARTLDVDGERWLYFHHAGEQPTFGLPKRIEQTGEGDLSLRYLPLTEPIEDHIDLDPAGAVAGLKPQDLGQWDESGDVLTGRAAATGTAIAVAGDVADAHLTCEVRGEGASRAGVVLRSAGPPSADMFEQENHGLAVWLDFEQQRLVGERCTWVPGFGWGRFVLDQMGHADERRVMQEVRLQLPAHEWLHLRVMLRDRYLEAYLGDRWLLTLDAADHPRTGRVELTVERGEARFRALSLAALPPLDDAVQ